jgi:RNA polymerase sigma-70 factor (ECF subfamily)
VAAVDPGRAARPGGAEREQPDAVVVARETIELTYIALIQSLPRASARAILRDVLGWSAAETAGVLDTSVAAANSALQRAARRSPTRSPSLVPPT